jgi:hypothetical protein
MSDQAEKSFKRRNKVKPDKRNKTRYGTEGQSSIGITAMELRETAEFLESELQTFDDFSDVSPTLTEGDLKLFPRPSPENRAAEQGFSFLRKHIQGVIASLYALASAVERDAQLPPVAFLILDPYVNAYHAHKGSKEAK